MACSLNFIVKNEVVLKVTGGQVQYKVVFENGA